MSEKEITRLEKVFYKYSKTLDLKVQSGLMGSDTRRKHQDTLDRWFNVLDAKWDSLINS